MSSRFHNKFHRHNHHTNQGSDPQYPDAGYDPIASPDSPFQGDFILNGGLSATLPLSADMNFPGSAVSTIIPIETTGEFLRVFVDGVERYIRLWVPQS
jgi:hypothetical protein